MRVTHNVMEQRMLANLRLGYARMAETQHQVSTGKRLHRASDDPAAVADVRLRQSQLDGLARHKEAANGAISVLEASDTAVGRLGDVLARARELALQGANGTLNPVDRARIADEIDQLAEAAKDAMNVRLGDQYLFAGTATLTAPYAAGTGDAYQGDANPVSRDVGPSVPVQLNPTIATIPSPGTEPLTGEALLGGGQAAGDGRILDALRDLSEHLRGGTDADLQAIRTTDLQAIEANQRVVLDARSAVGATQNRVEAALDRLTDLHDASELALADIEGVDLAEALTKLSSQQTAYQAALQTGARIIQPSLLDFLR